MLKMEMDKLLIPNMERALKLFKALEVAQTLEDEYEVDKATRHAKTELKMVFKAIRKHSVILEKELK